MPFALKKTRRKRSRPSRLVPPIWSPCTASGEFDQGLQIDKAVLETISLLVPMTFRSSWRWVLRWSTNFGKWALGVAWSASVSTNGFGMRGWWKPAPVLPRLWRRATCASTVCARPRPVTRSKRVTSSPSGSTGPCGCWRWLDLPSGGVMRRPRAPSMSICRATRSDYLHACCCGAVGSLAGYRFMR